jgi:hypothetical protein
MSHSDHDVRTLVQHEHRAPHAEPTRQLRKNLGEVAFQPIVSGDQHPKPILLDPCERLWRVDSALVQNAAAKFCVSPASPNAMTGTC